MATTEAMLAASGVWSANWLPYEADAGTDVIVGRGVGFLEAGVGPADVWGELSDHLPVWATVDAGVADGRP